MENKNINPSSGDDTSWLDELLESSSYGEDAIQDLSGSVEDLELERIIREAKADEWDLTDIIESQQAAGYEEEAPPKPAFDDPEVAAQVYWDEDEEESFDDVNNIDDDFDVVEVDDYDEDDEEDEDEEDDEEKFE